MRKLFILLVILAPLLTLANSDVTINVNPVNNSVIYLSNQYAFFDITISNPYSYEEAFNIDFRDMSWVFWSEPYVDLVSGFTIPAESNYTLHLFVKPKHKKPIGRYAIPFFVKTKKGHATYSDYLFVDIISGQPPLKEYALGLLVSVDMPASVDPRKKQLLELSVENVFPSNITGLMVKVWSSLFSFNTTIDLGPLDRQRLIFPIEFNPRQSPIDDTVTVDFILEGQVIKSVSKRYSIASYSQVVKKDEELKKNFLKYTYKVAFYNDGNVPTKFVHQVKLKPFQRVFVHTKPEYYLVKNQQGSFLTWELELEPGESNQITITQSYRSLFVVALIIVVIVLFYLFMRSPFVIEKEAKVLEIKDGAISKLRVMIHLKNKSKKPLKDVRLADRVPHIATVEKGFDIGTLKPDKIVKDAKGGTVLKWHIPLLEPLEERIVYYNIKSGLQVLGEFSLPPALAKFKTESGADLTVKSKPGKLTY